MLALIDVVAVIGDIQCAVQSDSSWNLARFAGPRGSSSSWILEEGVFRPVWTIGFVRSGVSLQIDWCILDCCSSEVSGAVLVMERAARLFRGGNMSRIRLRNLDLS